MKKTVRIMITIVLTAALFPGLSGCSGKEGPGAKKHSGKMRVISLSPSLTKQMIDLDAEDLLVGVTSYHPVLKRKVEVVGSLVTPSFEKILMLEPDLILFSREDRIVQNTSRLRSMGINTLTLGGNTGFESICSNYILLGEKIGKKGLAEVRIRDYRKQRESVKSAQQKTRMALIVSHVPLMAASGTSYINSIIGDAGGINIYNDLKNPFSIISVESLIQRDPEVIISMMPDTHEHFEKIFRNFTNIHAVKNKKIFEISPDNIAHYTPADYIKSVEIISRLLNDKKTKK